MLGKGVIAIDMNQKKKKDLYAEQLGDPPIGRARPPRLSPPEPPIPYDHPWYYSMMYYPWFAGSDLMVKHRGSLETNELLNDITKSINGEYSAIICYGELAKQAPDAATRDRIMEIRRDEERHLREISRLYYLLTGKQAEPQQSESCPSSYQAGLHAAFMDEQKTVDFYHEVADKARSAKVKQVFRRAAFDEQNHAVWFLYFLSN